MTLKMVKAVETNGEAIVVLGYAVGEIDTKACIRQFVENYPDYNKFHFISGTYEIVEGDDIIYFNADQFPYWFEAMTWNGEYWETYSCENDLNFILAAVEINSMTLEEILKGIE